MPKHPNVTSTGWDYDMFLCAGAAQLPVHVQYLYSTLDLPPGPLQLREIAYRRNNWYANPVPPSTLQLSLTMSHGPREPSATSTAFAINHGPDTTVVFNGLISWPAAPFSGPAPAPFVLPVKLSTPFLVVAARGKSLVLDYAITGGPTYACLLDAAGRGLELLDWFGTNLSCLSSTGKPIAGVGYLVGLWNTGGKWSLGFSPVPPNATGVVSFSGFGSDRKGPWPLPIDLTPYGMPACWWHLGFELGLYVPLNSWGYTPPLTIPPGLGGQRVYAQGLFRDPGANAAGWVVTTAAGFVVGTGVAASAATVWTLSDYNNSPDGIVQRSFSPIFEGRY